jgi:predicted MarR family transcription regulator
MHDAEDVAFIESITTGVKDRNNIENILESAKLLDGLYESAAKKREVVY